MQSVYGLLPVPLIIYPGIIDANKRWEFLDKHLLLIYKDIGEALNSSIKDFLNLERIKEIIEIKK